MEKNIAIPEIAMEYKLEYTGFALKYMKIPIIIKIVPIKLTTEMLVNIGCKDE